MSGYLSIPGIEEFQHYKDRNPAWIKLYSRVLRDYDFACLQDASKAHLIQIWVLASQMENKIPNDSEWIGKQINATTKVDLTTLIKKGFVVCSEPLANRKQDDIPETYSEETDKKKKRARQKVSFEELSVEHLSPWLEKKRAEGKYVKHDENFVIEYFKNYCESNGKTYDNYVSALKNAFEWDACQPKPEKNGNGATFKPSGPAKPLSDDERAKIIRWNMKRNGYAVNPQDEQFLREYEAREAQHA